MLAEISTRLGDHFRSWWNKTTSKWQKKLSICPPQMLNFSQSFITFSRYHSFSMYANFSEKLTFQGVNVSFSENFAYLLNEWDPNIFLFKSILSWETKNPKDLRQLFYYLLSIKKCFRYFRLDTNIWVTNNCSKPINFALQENK